MFKSDNSLGCILKETVTSSIIIYHTKDLYVTLDLHRTQSYIGFSQGAKGTMRLSVCCRRGQSSSSDRELSVSSVRGQSMDKKLTDNIPQE